jgi:hypothetical protein
VVKRLAGIAAASLLSALGCRPLEPAFDAKVAEALRARPAAAAPLLREEDLAHLPPPVRRYVLRSGAVGKPRVRSFELELDARMYRKPGSEAMAATSVQHNSLEDSTRLFFMRARMFGLPVQVLHAYAAGRATMQVRVASLVDLVDESGDVLSRGETVTVLNDTCFFAPGALVDPRLAWEQVDERTARVTFANGRHQVAAILHFDAEGDLVDFTSDDRPALVDGKFLPYRWSTPAGDYREVEGRRVPTRAAAVYRYPGGDFTYGRFVVTRIAWDVARP